MQTSENLFFFDRPRLSADIDLNYIGQLDMALICLFQKELENKKPNVWSNF